MNANSKAPRKTSAAPPRRRLLSGGVVAFIVAATGAGAAAYAIACSGGSEADGPVDGRVSAVEAAGSQSAEAISDTSQPGAGMTSGPKAAPTSNPSAAPTVDATYDGPFLGAMALTTPVYPEMRFGNERVGYIRQGGKVPVDPKPTKKANCKEGWYRLLEGGYVCGKYATLDMNEPRVKLGVRQPDVNATVPYQYAYNLHHGTPLYKALPSREEMLRFEPHLAEKEKAEKEKEKEREREKAAEDPAAPAASGEAERPKGKHPPPAEGTDGNVPSSDASAAVAAIAPMDPATIGTDEAPNEPPKPWWQNGEKNPNVSLSDLEKDAGGTLSKRMVKGFFVAVDKTLSYAGRFFYRTTGGLLAPTDRMVINKAPTTKGVDWPEGAKAIFFSLGEKAQKLELSKDEKKMSPKAKLAKFAAVGLTGKTLELEGALYREATEGFWVKDSAGTITSPNPRPSDVGANERWVDVNLEKKTLVLFEGDKPMYAALVSPGKRSRNKKKDHPTPTGSWRIREKHVSVTMDGDGASGDLPYSIEDVPYVAYFKGSYALHAAFWHNNFGREMSHGCVNLSPLDAKVVFNFVEPRLPRGFHGAFSSGDHAGSMVVVHE